MVSTADRASVTVAMPSDSLFQLAVAAPAAPDAAALPAPLSGSAPRKVFNRAALLASPSKALGSPRNALGASYGTRCTTKDSSAGAVREDAVCVSNVSTAAHPKQSTMSAASTGASLIPDP